MHLGRYVIVGTRICLAFFIYYNVKLSFMAASLRSPVWQKAFCFSPIWQPCLRALLRCDTCKSVVYANFVRSSAKTRFPPADLSLRR